ncbi:hypothetical protein BD410DRAFT_753107 [Rickenella mellea]|uniref:Cyclin N-terminal domain-containing protein n=1 Tax=Rickenella mellea TaxID=50990 RepID=A0A4Y7PVD2_9AGAM|nr:hypothetical protein BD410DRAFT_753107 [Rickenella mellea]
MDTARGRQPVRRPPGHILSLHSESPSSHSNASQAPYYGYRVHAKISARFIKHNFSCPEELPPLFPTSPPTNISLTHFIAYALHRTRLDHLVLFTALALLRRLKTLFPAAQGSAGHQLFLPAYMIAAKVVYDSTLSSTDWRVVGQNMFPLRMINQMERVMCGRLEWRLHASRTDLDRFTKAVCEIYEHAPPYVHTELPSVHTISLKNWLIFEGEETGLNDYD